MKCCKPIKSYVGNLLSTDINLKRKAGLVNCAVSFNLCHLNMSYQPLIDIITTEKKHRKSFDIMTSSSKAPVTSNPVGIVISYFEFKSTKTNCIKHSHDTVRNAFECRKRLYTRKCRKERLARVLHAPVSMTCCKRPCCGKYIVSKSAESLSKMDTYIGDVWALK